MRHPFRRFERYHQRRTRRQNFANSSQKLKFTADDTSFVNDGITLAYYMSLAGEAAAKSPHPAGRLAKVKLLPSNAESKTKAPIEPNKELPDGVKNILLLMSDKNGAQVADVEELSKKLGKLAATSMNFATVAGSEKASGPEDLTESQWARILANNRALRGYYLNGASGIMRKAPKGAFNLAPRKGDGTTTNNTGASSITVLLDCGLKAHKWLHVVMKQAPSDIPILRSASPETAKQDLMRIGQPKSERNVHLIFLQCV
ncbi:hypothetical protein CNMCM6069_009276 [Aspergillus lentulus]|nr:hypothetical protein CNMCM6069_009276 [Aspergillus lentulus]KAF4181810.1 hypothetical protein CNMCM8060_008181 [Aspergillus lentulus]KAF4198146.1 hypothetical protein CNMCM8694_000830 [Aspergillus lentulus]